MNEKVAIIDSGVGGLTVFQQLLWLNMDNDITYLADNKLFPYGLKKDYELINIIDRLIHYFLQLNYHKIILACNTASYIYNKYLKYRYQGLVYSIIESTINDLTLIPSCKRVGIIATDNTIKSRIYQTEILKQFKVEIFPFEANELVRLCESFDQKGISNYLKHNFNYFKEMKIDTLILGCTHFNNISSLVADFFDHKVRLICSGYSLIDAKKKSLENNGIHSHLIYLTDYTEEYSEKIKKNFPILKNIQIEELNI